MIVSVGREDVLALCELAGLAVDLSGFSLTDRMRFVIPTPVGAVHLEVTALAIDGEIELNITRATVLGIRVFGLVRTKAAAMIMERLKPYSRFVTLRKAANGNLRLAVAGVRLESVLINTETRIAFTIL